MLHSLVNRGSDPIPLFRRENRAQVDQQGELPLEESRTGFADLGRCLEDRAPIELIAVEQAAQNDGGFSEIRLPVDQLCGRAMENPVQLLLLFGREAELRRGTRVGPPFPGRKAERLRVERSRQKEECEGEECVSFHHEPSPPASTGVSVSQSSQSMT